MLQTIDTGSIDQPSVEAGAGAVWVTWNDGTIKARGAAVTGLGAANIGAFNAEGQQRERRRRRTVRRHRDRPDRAGRRDLSERHGDLREHRRGRSRRRRLRRAGSGVDDERRQVRLDHGAGQPDDRRRGEPRLRPSGGANGGRLYLAYTDETPDESNDTDVFVRRSTDNGATWSAPVQVNDDGTTRSQFLPNISVDQTNGNVAMTWHDARNDAGNNNTQFFGSASTTAASRSAQLPDQRRDSNDDTAWKRCRLRRLHLVRLRRRLSTRSGRTTPTARATTRPAGTPRFDIYTSRVRIAENKPPVVTVANAAGNEGATIPISGTATDPDADPLTATWSFARPAASTPARHARSRLQARSRRRSSAPTTERTP